MLVYPPPDVDESSLSCVPVLSFTPVSAVVVVEDVLVCVVSVFVVFAVVVFVSVSVVLFVCIVVVFATVSVGCV